LFRSAVIYEIAFRKIELCGTVLKSIRLVWRVAGADP
jgi:hypothetical protein